MRLIMTMLIAVVLVFASVEARTYPLTDRQENLLKIAYDVGKPQDLSKALMGILVQETRAGIIGPVGDQANGFGERSYGPMQMKLVTAQRMIDEHCPELDPGHSTEEELIVELLTQDEWAIQMALCYLTFLEERGLTWREILLAYNRGFVGAKSHDADTHPYVQDVIHHVTEGVVHQFLENRGLQ